MTLRLARDVVASVWRTLGEALARAADEDDAEPACRVVPREHLS